MEPQFQEVDGQRHVKVRVPVIVDAEGNWSAYNYSDRAKSQIESEICHTADSMGYDHIRRMYWLYALVPVPDHDKHTVIGCEPELK